MPGGQRHPNANIGLPTGARTGVLVVDVDVHSGGSGFQAFERARSEGIGDHWGWLVRTPSGGVHAYYPTGADVEQRSWQVPSAHVDFRGDGGYVIAPPSRIEVDGAMRTYDVIAVTTQPAKPVDATKLRQFLEPHRAHDQPAAASRARRLPDATRRPLRGRSRSPPRVAATGLSSGRRAGWRRTTSPRRRSPAG